MWGSAASQQWKIAQVNHKPFFNCFYNLVSQICLKKGKGLIICSSTVGRRVARIWKRGGLFWKSEKSANDLDPNFHCSGISFTRFVRKFRRNFSESSEIRRFFPPKIRWSPKKKKKKRSSPILRLIFRPKSEIQSFFPPKIRWSPKKKKRSPPKLRLIFRPISEIQTYEGGCFPMGGAIFNFSQKIGLKSTKNVRFCILHKPMGGLEPPPPPPPCYATDCRCDKHLEAVTANSFVFSVLY